MDDTKVNEILLVTDGSCANIGPRTGYPGWSYILVYGKVERERSGTFAYPATNQTAELTAALKGLEAIRRPMSVTLCSDSEYLLKGFLGLNGQPAWTDKWITNKWRNSNGGKVINRELWEELLRYKSVHKITPLWVRSHIAISKQTLHCKYNARCGELAARESLMAYERSISEDLTIKTS